MVKHSSYKRAIVGSSPAGNISSFLPVKNRNYRSTKKNIILELLRVR